MATTDQKYRPDIDGLRGVAILMAITFHVSRRFFPGGFAAMDIFFVISGFLITGQIRDQIGTGTFTLSGFYARRIKRILPMFFFAGFITLLAGCLLFLPEN